MKTLISAVTAVTAGLFVMGIVLVADVGSAQEKKGRRAADCPQGAASPGPQGRAGAPEKLEGEVVAVDPNREIVTLRATDGTTHEFRASKDDIRDYKVGDKVDLKLRTASGC